MKLIEVAPASCTGCRLCEMVCTLVHEGECSTTRSRIRIFRDEEFGNHLASVCQQCFDPLCVAACAYGALNRDGTTGVVSVDGGLCNGCGICVTACPIGAIISAVNGDSVFKCDLCDGDPECVKVCTRGILTMKEVDPASPARKTSRDETARLLSEMRLAAQCGGFGFQPAIRRD